MKRILLFTILLMIFSSISYAEGLSIGLGYPYVSLKYDFPVISLEGRFVTESGIKAYSSRGYWNYYRDNTLNGFAGLEGGYIRFDTLDTKGTGYEGALFIGGEYFITDRLSLILDLAPTFISLQHADDSSVKVSGVEFVGNIGLYFHFGNIGNMDTGDVVEKENTARDNTQGEDTEGDDDEGAE
jgi:hypothetical protein